MEYGLQIAVAAAACAMLGLTIAAIILLGHLLSAT